MLASILAVLSGFFNNLIPFVEKYFQPPTAESKVEDAKKKVNEEEQSMKQGGRPSWN